MASTSHNPTPTSFASPSPTTWDVFLSFRGEDTGNSFTDYLYDTLHRAGIRTFRDKFELRSGEVISEALVQAIQESKMYVVVLSENYASSRWCLDELVEILIRCCESMDRLVLPVFYNIEPSVVRYQTGKFSEAFQKHANRLDGNYKLDKWRHTLEVVANFSGYEVDKNKSQVDVINEIVSKVLDELNPSTFDDPKYQVGLDSRVKDIETLLSDAARGVIRIGIYGMGGVGKTTLAKAVYNQNYRRFQGSCFLENVRETSQTREGIVCLQRKLIHDVLKCKNITIDNADLGIKFIRARMCSTKVLIVIDDLDNASSLDFLIGTFALESAIIITTRDGDLLDSIDVDAKYKVSELDHAESRQLFCRHAFGGDTIIPDTLRELSEEILKRAGGLPLALQVCGSALLNKSEEGWRWYINKLRRVSIFDVEKILLISFHALKLVDPMLQDIFLDIACFFIGNSEEEVIKIMEACYTCVGYNIDILKKRCLLTINYKGLMMHDLLLDMGRKIACNNSPNAFEKHTRLWVSEDIQKLLKENQGTEAINGINDFDIYLKDMKREIANNNSLDAVEKHPRKHTRSLILARLWVSQNIQKLLKMNPVTRVIKGIGNFDIYLEDKQESIFPSNLHGSFTRTYTLENIQDLISGFHQPKHTSTLNKVTGLEHLKNLNMSYCNWTTTTDLTSLSSLETLSFTSCEGLKEVHMSIGSLVSLVSLNFRHCENLKSLPDSICNLRALKSLNIGHCSNLEAIPMNLGDIESLEELNAEWLTINKLPHSIGHLSKLIKLNLSFCGNLQTLPDSFCNLRSLEILNISWCSRLKELPKELRNLESLVELKAETLPTVSKLLLFKQFT